ncbi:MAG: PEP-CTERM sorting domain-containing protein [Planctomycetota bacterium]|nr:PEP-CTERM sorting domain-containing protein [Planctomycetota bacterium]
MNQQRTCNFAPITIGRGIRRLTATMFMTAALVSGLSTGVSAKNFDVILGIDRIEFSSFGSAIQNGTGGNSYSGNYKYISNWNASGQPSGLVKYTMPNEVQFPTGERLYNVYIWNTTANNGAWRAYNIAADGSLDFQQDISWPGQFGTNKQWLGFAGNMAIDPGPINAEGGRWVKLGPGPQSDWDLTGIYEGAVYMNPTKGDPYVRIEYNTGYTTPMAFDAIRIVEISTEAAIAGDLNSDGFVGQDDLNIVLGKWGQNVTLGQWYLGDPSRDAFVGQDDLNAVLGGWGQGNPPEVESVPEPSSIALVLIGCAGAATAAYRQRRIRKSV